MSYYQEKIKAQADIKKLMEKKVCRHDIEFYILETYGFGNKMVIEYYDLLSERGYLKKDKKVK